MMKANLADIRKQYQMAELNREDCLLDPISQFKVWMDEAIKAEVREATAMTLSTVDGHHKPHSRVVLLKDIIDGMFVFYSNYESHKAKDMIDNPSVSLSFFWPQLERQIRIEGVVAMQDRVSSEQYFQSRPRGSQLSAWASPQSSIVNSKDEMIKLRKQAEAKFDGQEVLEIPPFWGGFLVKPTSIEFWQGRPSRFHDRIKYLLEDDLWEIVRLAP